MFHLFLHFAIPALIAAILFPKKSAKVFFILVATMLVDIDHVVAEPIYDPLRCSIGFHPFHQWPAILFYGLMFLFSKTRLIGLGLLVHMALDSIDCKTQLGVWFI